MTQYFLQALQRTKIPVELFPHRLTHRICRLNEQFIRAQESLGITITSIHDDDVWEMGNLTIRGRYRNDPRDNTYAMVLTTTEGSHGLRAGLWPQSKVTVAAGSNDEWEATVQFGEEQDVTVCIVRANELGQEMIRYYREMQLEREKVIAAVMQHYHAPKRKDVYAQLAPTYWPLPETALRKGLYIEAKVKISIKGGHWNERWSQLVSRVR